MILTLVAGACALALSGCLEWVEQTVTYQHDPKADEARVFQEYHGLFAGDGEGELSKEEVEQLDSVLKGQRTFFFANWIFEFTRSRIEEALQNSLAATPGGEGEELARKVAQKRDGEALMRLLLDNVRVENGEFHLDGQKRLCGTQRVTVRKVSALVPAANRVLRGWLTEEAAKEDRPAEQRLINQRWLDRKENCLTIEGNRIEYRMPMSGAEYEKAFLQDANAGRMARALAAAGGELRHEENVLVVRMGKPGDKQVSLRMPMSEKAYRPNLEKHLQGRQPVVAGYNPTAAREAFFKAGTAGAKR